MKVTPLALDDGNKLIPAPACLFDVSDSRASRYWHASYDRSRLLLTLEPKEFIDDPYLSEHILDRDPDAWEVFSEVSRRMEAEGTWLHEAASKTFARHKPRVGAKHVLDYDQLKLFYQVVVGVIFEPRYIQGDANPIRVLERMEKESRALARKGLRLSISDAMSKLRDERPETLAALSAKLEEAGAPSLEMIRAFLSKKWATIVKRGSIETDEQFYLVRELVDDPSLTSVDRDRLHHMLEAYEAKN